MSNGQTTGNKLSDEDRSALTNFNTDTTDLDEATVERASEGFRQAYSTAERVVNGSLDPLTA